MFFKKDVSAPIGFSLTREQHQIYVKQNQPRIVIFNIRVNSSNFKLRTLPLFLLWFF